MVADRIEAVMPAEGITPGARECHDAQRDHERVDWIYPDARPRSFALEVTSIVAEVDWSGDAEARKLGRRLTALAQTEELGAWLVIVETDRDVRKMGPKVEEVLRQARPIREKLLAANDTIRLGDYTVEDVMRLPLEERSEFILARQNERELGIRSLTPIRSGRDHVVQVGSTRGDIVGSFSSELDKAIEAKRETLRLVSHLEGHLGVLLHRWDRSSAQEDTPVPRIPDEIDVLWIVHAWRTWLDDAHPVWVARRGETSWRVYTSKSR